MEYPLINTVLSALGDRLAALPLVEAATPSEEPEPLTETTRLIKDIRAACICGYENLFALMPELTAFPAAIIACGGGYYQDAAIRELEVAIIIIDEFQSYGSAESGYALLDRVSKSLTGESPGQHLKIGNINYLLRNFDPLELDSAHTAFLFDIKATAAFSRPN